MMLTLLLILIYAYTKLPIEKMHPNIRNAARRAYILKVHANQQAIII